MAEVCEGWWHPNTNAGRVHDHPEAPGRNWSVPMHRLCEKVYTKRATDNEVEAADVLDRMANPHPRMWREATAAFVAQDAEPRYWQGFLDAMCAATGYEPEYFLTKLEAEAHESSLARLQQYLASELIALKEAGGDCTQDQSAWILRYFDSYHPATTPEGIAMAIAYPLENDQWWSEVEAGHRTARP